MEPCPMVSHIIINVIGWSWDEPWALNWPSFSPFLLFFFSPGWYVFFKFLNNYVISQVILNVPEIDHTLAGRHNVLSIIKFGWVSGPQCPLFCHHWKFSQSLMESKHHRFAISPNLKFEYQWNDDYVTQKYIPQPSNTLWHHNPSIFISDPFESPPPF